MDEIRLKLPYPPTVNHYYGTAGKHRYLKPQGKKFREDVAYIIKQNNIKTLTDHEIMLTTWVTLPDKRERDLDNLNKAIQDSLSYGKAIESDKYIKYNLIVRKGYNKGNGFIQIELKKFNPDDHVELLNEPDKWKG